MFVGCAVVRVRQSTFCKMMQEHGAATHRSIRVANMDPAAEEFKYKLDFGT